MSEYQWVEDDLLAMAIKMSLASPTQCRGTDSPDPANQMAASSSPSTNKAASVALHPNKHTPSVFRTPGTEPDDPEKLNAPTHSGVRAFSSLRQKMSGHSVFAAEDNCKPDGAANTKIQSTRALQGAKNKPPGEDSKGAPKAEKQQFPFDLKAMTEQAVVSSLKPDKNGNLVGRCTLSKLKGGQENHQIFFFHGPQAVEGLKFGGKVDTAGLELKTGDILGELQVQPGRKAGQIDLVRATLSALSQQNSDQRLAPYLRGLASALSQSTLRAQALSCLAQEKACKAICKGLAKLSRDSEILTNILDILESLVTASSSGSSRHSATATLNTILLSELSLPHSILGQVMQENLEDGRARAQQERLVSVAVNAFALVPDARRRLCLLLSSFAKSSEGLALRLLPPSCLLPLLAASLPGDENIACYAWRELPLHLLPTEMRARGHEAVLGRREDLREVRPRGAYTDLDDYMTTYVGLLREEAFASMRQGLSDLLDGKLDPRDMLVLQGSRLLAMSPPSTAGASSGTVLELRAKSNASKASLPMFGSLLAVAPKMLFERQTVWATVAGATVEKGELCIYAELCSGLNDEEDSEILVSLLRNSGELTVAESPTFYRASAPALIALQAMQPSTMPFAEEIIYGKDPWSVLTHVTNTIVDATTAFVAVGADSSQLQPVKATDFIKALDHFTERGAVSRTGPRLGGVEVSTTLDPSQCEALKTVLTRRIAIIRGPPGTGKTFIGVRALRLLLSRTSYDQINCSSRFGSECSWESESDASAIQSETGPALLLTYKNVALDDFLEECLKVWPDGVARIGGKAQGVLEQRHLAAIMRTTPVKRTDEHMSARDEAERRRRKVEKAAYALSQRRFFSARTILSACLGTCSHTGQGCASCKFLASLLENDPTSSEADCRAAMTALSRRDKEGDELAKLVSGLLNTWMPSVKECAKVCRGELGPAASSSRQAADQGGAKGSAAASGSKAAEDEEAEQEKQERSLYSWFEKASVRLEEAPEAGSRMVFELLDEQVMTDVEQKDLLNTKNVWELRPGTSRVRFMHALVFQIYSEAASEYDAAMNDFTLAKERLHNQEIRFQAAVLRSMKVVGMTISGASINRDLLEVLQPRIVFVEEAAEVLEPLLVASLGPWVERIVMIGDDKQLPPQVNTHVLARDFFFNTSLMKRLINNRMPHVSLSFQARMMPEFAELLLDVYPDYRTSDRVMKQQRPLQPPGLQSAMFFWDVQSSTREDSTGRSRVNSTEVDCVTALTVHLVRSGVKPKRITVLAPYSGQVQALRDSVRKHIKTVCQGGWPRREVHEAAAFKQLKTFTEQGRMPVADEGWWQQCIDVGQTFLKLGIIGGAGQAFQLLIKNARASSEAASSASKHLERIKLLQNASQAVDACWDGSAKVGRKEKLHDAISAVKGLDALWTRWGPSSVADCAAAGNLQSALAKRVLSSPVELQEKQRKLLQALDKAGAEHVAVLESQEELRVCSVDRYQGSENDYVIVSLVRCNSNGDIGFLKEPARRVVAQSRARLGMYFVGSRSTFDKSEHWRRLTQEMAKRDCLGNKMVMTCSRHGTKREVSPTSDDVKSVISNGVCSAKCAALMGCGIHKCSRKCHGDGEDAAQLHAVCEALVQVDKCSLGLHTIQRKCSQTVSSVRCPLCEKAEREDAKRQAEARREIEQAEREKEERERLQRDRQVRAEVDSLLAEIKRRPAGLQKEELHGHGNQAAEYFRVMDRTEKYVQAGHHTPIAVRKIEKVFNRDLEARFLEAKKRLSSFPDCNLQELFHGTGSEGVEGIPRTGFRLPAWSEDNMFGMGVYFATDSSKSAQDIYTKGSGCLLLCEVLLGRACTVNGLQCPSSLEGHVKTSKKNRLYLDVDKDKVRRAGFDSVFAPRGTRDKAGVLFDEMIVYDPAQAIPRYIVHFSNGARTSEWRNSAQVVSGVSVRKIMAADVQESTDSRELHEFNFAIGNFARLVGEYKNVTQVDVYESAEVQRVYMEKAEEFAKRKKNDKIRVRWVFHGTESRNIEQICRAGFKVGGSDSRVPVVNGAVYGPGVYTAIGPSTPMGYSRGGSIILCQALPGVTGSDYRDPTIDSWSPKPDWMIFRTAEQLLPKYVLHF
eukprot:927172-Rhodomonas_salina.1